MLNFCQCSPSNELANLTETECVSAGGGWLRYSPGFDNIFEAIVTLFEVRTPNTYYGHTLEIYLHLLWLYSLLAYLVWPRAHQVSTLENWVPIMHAGMDATRPGQPPEKNAARQNALYFVAFIIVGSFVVLNLFVGVVIDTFQRISDETMGGAFMDSRQRDWVSANQIMLQLRPHKRKAEPRSRLRYTAYVIVESPYFEAMISLTILVNLVSMTLTYYDEPEAHRATLAILNLCFSAIFAVEAALKLLAYFPRQYFASGWNRFDFLLVLGSAADVAMQLAQTDVAAAGTPQLLRVIRVVRIARILRIVKSAARLRKLFYTLYLSLPSLANVGSLLFLLLFVYAVLGMEFFGQIVMQPTESFGLTRHANFRTWLPAMLLLLRMSSGEAWNSVMHDCAIQPAAVRAEGAHVLYGGWEGKAECDDDSETCGLSCCGSESLAVAYFLSFQVFCTFVLLNLVIAVILENFSSTAAESQSIITPDDTAQFQREWLRLDPAGTYFIPSVHFPQLLQRLTPPLGVRGLRLDSLQLLEYMRALQIPDRGGRMHFQEVSVATASVAIVSMAIVSSK